jgi:tetratricopeptide (TPR) repeat protein
MKGNNPLKQYIIPSLKSVKKILSRITVINFPHIPRIIPASLFYKGIKMSTVFILILFILTSLITDFVKHLSNEKKIQIQIMSDPLNYVLHEKLAEEYLKKNSASSEHEYLLAQAYFSNNSSGSNSVLGAKSSPYETWLNIKNFRKDIDNELFYWKKITESFPSYSYGYLKQAYGYFRLGNNEKSLQLLENALQNNPADKNALMLKSKILKG